jgi:hypothetical protein
MKRSLITLTIVSMFLALYLIGCGGGDGVSNISSIPSNPSDGTGSITFTVPWSSGTDISAQLIQDKVASVKMEVKTTAYASLNPPKSVEVKKGDLKPTTISGIPAGDYLVDCQGLDASGNIVSRRVRKATVTAGKDTGLVAILGVSIINGAFSPSNIALAPGDDLYWGNEDFGKNKTYWVKFIINGKVTQLGPITEGNMVNHQFLDSELTSGGNVNIELYEGTQTNPTGSVINQGTLQVGSPTGNSYEYKGRWGELSLNGYDANNGWSFITADTKGYFYVSFYNPEDVYFDLTTTTPYTDRNLIEKYDADGKHVRSVKFYTDGIIKKILGIEVDRDGRYLYVACFTAATQVGTVLSPIRPYYTVYSSPAVLRYDAQAGGTPVSLGYKGGFDDAHVGADAPLSAAPDYPAVNAHHDMADDIQGITIGYDPSTKNAKYLYVVDASTYLTFTGAAVPEIYASIGTIHRADISSNSNAPTWDGDNGWNSAPVIPTAFGYNSVNYHNFDPINNPTAEIKWTGIPTNLMGPYNLATELDMTLANPVATTLFANLKHPTEIAITADSNVLYLLNDKPHDTSTNLIKRYDAISGNDINHSDLTYPGPTFLSGIATNTSPSVAGSGGTGSDVFVVTASTAGRRAESVFRYNGAVWSPWISSRFTRPLALDCQDKTTATQPYVPYLYGLNFANADITDTLTPGVGYTAGTGYKDSNLTAVIDLPPAAAVNMLKPSCNGAALNVAVNGPIGANGDYGLLPRSFKNNSIAVVPTSDGYVLVGDYFHHISKWNNNASLFDDWRMPQDSFAIAFDLDKDASGNIYLSDAGNCRVLKFNQAYQYLGQWGLPVYSGFTLGSFLVGDSVLNLATTYELNTPLGIGIDQKSGQIYVVDRDRNGLDAWFVGNGNGLVGTGLRGRVQQFASNVGTKGNGPIAAVNTQQWWGSSARQFCFATGMAVDAEGDLYIADTGDGPNPGEGVGNGNGLLEDVVQKMTNTGQGRFQFTGAPPNDIGLHPPMLVKDVIVDDTNNIVYVSDRWNSVIKYNKTSPVSTGWVGTTRTAGGSHQDGEFNIPSGVALDKDKYLYVVDTRNARVQKFAIKGDGYVTNWDSGQLRHPWGIVVSATNSNVFVTDRVHNRVVEYAPVLK